MARRTEKRPHKDIYDRDQQRNKLAGTPAVGIVFLVGDRLLIDHTPVSEAETYGDFKIHARGHDTFWAVLKQAGVVPVESEYDDYPRGRVAYNRKTRKFLLFLDRCILKRKSVVKKFMSELHLPSKDTKTDTDDHYRCPGCLRNLPQETGCSLHCATRR